MRTIVVYYSLTGRTESLCLSLASKLKELGLEVEIFKAMPKRKYSFSIFITPRAFFETLSGRTELLEDPPAREYDLAVLSSPIWFGRPVPPVIEASRKLLGNVKRAAAIVTCMREREYEKRFKGILEGIGYEVILARRYRSWGEKEIEDLSSEIISSLRNGPNSSSFL